MKRIIAVFLIKKNENEDDFSDFLEEKKILDEFLRFLEFIFLDWGETLDQ